MAHYVIKVNVLKVPDALVSKYEQNQARPEPVEISQFVTKGAELGETIVAAAGHLDLVTDPFLPRVK